MVDAGRLHEFRQTDIRQAKELEDLRAAYSGLDPAAVREMLEDIAGSTSSLAIERFCRALLKNRVSGRGGQFHLF